MFAMRLNDLERAAELLHRQAGLDPADPVVPVQRSRYGLLTYMALGHTVTTVNRAALKLRERFRERGEQKKLSAETEIDQGYLSQLATGKRVAGLGVRRKLVPHGISLEDWDEPIAEESSPGAAAAEKGAA